MKIDLTKPFTSLEEAEAALRDTGVYTVTSRTIKDAFGQPKARLRRCAQWRRRPSTAREGAQRQGRACGTGCPYQLWIRHQFDGCWYFQSVRNDDASKHNHDLPKMESFGRVRMDALRKLRDDVVSASNTGLPPRRIIQQLSGKDGFDVSGVSGQDIRNVLREYEREQLENHLLKLL